MLFETHFRRGRCCRRHALGSGVQVDELQQQFERKPGFLGSECFNYSRAQPIKFGDELAAFVVGQHGA